MFVPIATSAAPPGWAAEVETHKRWEEGLSVQHIRLPVVVYLTMRDFADVKGGNIVVPGVIVESCPQIIALDDLDMLAEELEVDTVHFRKMVAE